MSRAIDMLTDMPTNISQSCWKQGESTEKPYPEAQKMTENLGLWFLLLLATRFPKV